MESTETVLRNPPRPLKVVVVGAGQVGSTSAYARLLEGVVGEIVLIDINRGRDEGEAMDLTTLRHLAAILRGFLDELDVN